MIIGTHSGTFHCDEALACFLLKCLPKFHKAEIIRTRDQKVLDALPIVVDVGQEYDPNRLRFDHHQKGFNETFNKDTSVKLSSAGLIYKHFGREILLQKFECPKDTLDLLFNHIYHGFIKEIDAIDNGQNQYETSEPPLYDIRTNLSKRVSYLNPPWNETFTHDKVQKRFMRAVELAGHDFSQFANYCVKEWLPARSIVQKAFDERFAIDPSGRIIQLDRFCPWREHIFDIKGAEGVLFIIFGGQDNWRVCAIPKRKGTFENRKSLKSSWRALSGDKLCEESGIDGCVFVHASGFIGGNKTCEGALKMAQESVICEED